MTYEINYVWHVPTKENLCHTETLIAYVDVDSFGAALDAACVAIEAQEPPRLNWLIDVGHRRCTGAWVKDQPEGRYTWGYVSWCSEFVYQPKKSMRWYAVADPGMPKEMRRD